MLLNSFGFLIFFSLFFFIHWSVSGNKQVRNLLLLAAGVYLYSLWDLRFLGMLCSIITLNYFSGIALNKDSIKGKFVFYSALVLNLLPLFYFKYYNFFIENLSSFSSVLGLNFNFDTMNLILPVGISFYTFLSISYLIDVYKKQLQPEKNIINYALSICYFPIIMSGPIHRPRIFLEQLKKENKFDYMLAAEGLRQIMTGLFMKVVIADSIAKHVNTSFNGYDTLNGVTLILGTIYFSFQLYFDFAGYSEMAIGISKLLGFRISRNFSYPYLSRTIADFWKRWHISLTQWFRDYIFLPLSYIVSRKVKPGSIFDSDMFIYSVGIFVTWTLTGIWHGTGWNYILWGMVHAVLLIANKGFFKSKKKILKRLGLKKDSLPIIMYESTLTMLFVNIGWIFFRSGSASKSFAMIGRILDLSNWSKPEIPIVPLFIGLFIILLEYFKRDREFLFDISTVKPVMRWGIYIIVTLMILYSGNESTFIYAGF